MPRPWELDESKVTWIVRRKAEGKITNRQIAEAMGVKVRWVQVLWSRYRHLSPAEIQFPLPMGRPSGGMAGRWEHGAVAGLHSRRRAGAARMEGYIERNTGIHIPHRTIHEILDADGEVQGITKGGRGGRVRRECSHSNMVAYGL